MKNFIPLIKLHIDNKLTHSISMHQVSEAYSIEAIQKLGIGSA